MNFNILLNEFFTYLINDMKNNENHDRNNNEFKDFPNKNEIDLIESRKNNTIL